MLEVPTTQGYRCIQSSNKVSIKFYVILKHFQNYTFHQQQHRLQTMQEYQEGTRKLDSHSLVCILYHQKWLCILLGIDRHIYPNAKEDPHHTRDRFLNLPFRSQYIHQGCSQDTAYFHHLELFLLGILRSKHYRKHTLRVDLIYKICIQ